MKRAVMVFAICLSLITLSFSSTVITTAGVSLSELTYGQVARGEMGDLNISSTIEGFYWGFSFQQPEGFTPLTVKVEGFKNGSTIPILLAAPPEYDYPGGVIGDTVDGDFYLSGSLNQGPVSILRLRNIFPENISEVGGFTTGDRLTMVATLKGNNLDNTPFSKTASASIAFIPEPSAALLALLGLSFVLRRTRE